MEMGKKRGIIFCLLFLFPFGALLAQTQEALNIFEQNKERVLTIVAYGENKNEVGVGAGFVVGDGELVVTSYHVVGNAYSVEAQNAKGKKVKVEGIIVVDRNMDLALLKIKGKLPSLALGDSDKVGLGNRVFTLGGREIIVSEGTVIDLLKFTAGKRIFKASLTYREGFSGGPLLNLEGQAVGVTVDLGSGLEFIVPINQIKSLIKSGTVTNFKSWNHEDYSSSAKGAFLAGRVFLLIGEPGKARNYLEKVVSAEPNNIEAYSDLASANFQVKYFDSAASAYRKIVQLDPNKEDALYGLGLSYVRMRRYPDAVEPLKKAIQLNPKNTDAYYQLGTVYEELRDFEKALETYKQYIGLNPESKWAGYLRIGVCAKETGQYEEAINAYKRALEEKPDDVSICTKLAETYQMGNQFDNAAEAYENLVRLDPSQATFYYGKVVKMYDSAGDYEKAIKAAEKIVELNPKSELAVYNLAIMYQKLEKPKQAIETLKKALIINPNYDLAYYNIGLNYFKLENYKEAVDAFKKFIEITPDNADAWYNIGVGYMQLKNFEAALEPLRKSLELRPDYNFALYNLAITYLNLKDNYSAREVYKKLVEIDQSLASKLKQHIK